MARNDDLMSRVKAAIGRIPRVEQTRMFGGITFMVWGKMCVSMGPARIMCRIDPAIHDTALARKGCRTVLMKGRPNAVNSKRGLDYWIGLALGYKIAPACRQRDRGFYA
jgi:hypothetical protein